MKTFLTEEKRIIDLMKKDWWEYTWDVFFQKWKWKNSMHIGIWYDLMWPIIRLNMPLKEAKSIVKKYDIKRIIDEDNNQWYIQSIYDLDYKNTNMPDYKIKRSLENEFDNHSMNNSITEVWSILRKIRDWKLDINKVLQQINK